MPLVLDSETDGEGHDGGDKPPLNGCAPANRNLSRPPALATAMPNGTTVPTLRTTVATPPPSAAVQSPQNGRFAPSSHLAPNGRPAPHAPSRPPHSNNTNTNTTHPNAPGSSSVSGTSSQGYSSDSDSGGLSPNSSRPPSRVSAQTKSQSALQTPTVAKTQPATPQPKSAPSSRPPSIKSLKSDDGHKFNLKDLLGGPGLRRRNSNRSDSSSRKSDSEQSDGCPDSTASLLKKYGVCGRVAIGKGATSVVRLAHKWDHAEEKLYAVKEFRKRRKNETEKEYVKKLTSEFCISSTLHHCNVVETVDLVQDENHNWCEVMEYCAGGDLYAVIKKGGMQPPEIECCFRQLLCGVAYLHSQGVAHRDIKPENLFFDGKGLLKIGDYGASTVYRLPWEATVHKSTGLCGSEPYIAPEQFNNQPYDARLVDVWACGIVYYCMHFQEIPWRIAQASDPLYAQHAKACAGAPNSCPPAVAGLQPRPSRPLLRKMLEPDPRLRTLIEDVVKYAWVQSIDMCGVGKVPKHTHVQCCSAPP